MSERDADLESGQGERVKTIFVQVDVIEPVSGAEVCEWSGQTGRMRPHTVLMFYSAPLGADRWSRVVTLEGLVVRRDDKDGRATAHQSYHDDERGDTLSDAPQWVRDLVHENEPPAHMRGA